MLSSNKAVTRLVALVIAITAIWCRLRADDVVTRKPLPKFIRNAVVADRYLGTRDVDELLQFERAEPVCVQFLKRAGIPEIARIEAIDKLAEIRNSDPVAELLPWIEQFDSDVEGTAEDRLVILQDLTLLLPQQTALNLKQHRDKLLELAAGAMTSATRQAALAALTVADQSTDAAWQLSTESSDVLLDLLLAVPQLPPDVPRQELYSNVKPLLRDAANDAIQSAAIEAIALLDDRGRETFDALSEFVLQGTHPDACVRAICNIPSDQWTSDRRMPLANGLLKHLGKMPLDRRTTTDAKNTTKLIKTLAGLLPSQDEAEVQAELDRLTVKVILIKTVEEQMRYDQTVLVLRAGQGVQIVFENHDNMPHNLVIVDSPAAREEIGIAADRMQNEPDALAKGYLPESDKILHTSKMLQPGERNSIFFVAPQKTGTYAYVCTFPGHWSKMYGAIAVVDRVDAFLAANQPLPSADELLGIRTVQWTYDQLAKNLSHLSSGRSFENGQRLFLRTSCFSCHTIGSEGGRIGPDLTKITDKYKTPEDVLKQIMTPSEKVEEKYATVVVETEDGRIVRGVIVQEDEDSLVIKQDPLASCDPTIIAKDEIEDVSRSRLSPMPEKLLNTILEEEHVYDLLAYLISGGNPNHELFQ